MESTIGSHIEKMYIYFANIHHFTVCIQYQYITSSVRGLDMDEYREMKEYTINELAKYNGMKDNPAYIAVDGVIYDVSFEPAWGGGSHFGIIAGTDASEAYKSCHSGANVLDKLKKVGVLKK